MNRKLRQFIIDTICLLLLSAMSGSRWMIARADYSETIYSASVTCNGTIDNYIEYSDAEDKWINATSEATLTLLQNVVIDKTITISGKKMLDLNGHGIRMLSDGSGPVFTIGNGSNLTINDSNGETIHTITLSGWRGSTVSDQNGTTNITSDGTGTLVVHGGFITGGKGKANSGITNGGGVNVSGSGSLTINGGNIIGNAASFGGGIFLSGGSVTMNGGMIGYNRGFENAGGVYASGGSFTMKSGSIRDNTAVKSGGGIFVNSGTVTLSGGTIENNKCNTGSDTDSRGGGVFIGEGGTLQISGGPRVTGNKRGSDTADNVSLGDNCFIDVTGTLENAQIGVSGTGAFSTVSNYNDVSMFFSDNASYGVGCRNDNILYIGHTVMYNGNGSTGGTVPADTQSPYLPNSTVTVLAKPDGLVNNNLAFAGWNTESDGTGNNGTLYHAGNTFQITENTVLYAQWIHGHEWSYNAKRDTITATCSGGESCTFSEGGNAGTVSLKIIAPERNQYGSTGNASATLQNLDHFNQATGLSVAESDIQYYNANRDGTAYAETGEALEEAPTGAGDYVAKITVQIGSGENGTREAKVGYTIAKADAPELIDANKPTANTLIYNGSDQALVTPPESSLNYPEYTLKYSTDGETWETTIPAGKDRNTYPVQAKYFGDQNHADSDQVSMEAQITEKQLTVSSLSVTAKNYDGTNTAYIDFSGAVIEGIVPSDQNGVSISAIDAVYNSSGQTGDDSANAGENKTVTIKSITLTGERAENYIAVVESQLTGNIDRTVPTIADTAKPAATNIQYGQKLSDSILSGGSAAGAVSADSLIGSFTWQSPDTVMDSTGSHSYTVVFTPLDSTNYTTATCEVDVKIQKADAGMPVVSMAGYTYGGNVAIPGITAYAGGGSCTFYYSQSENGGGSEWENIGKTTLDAGTYWLYAVIGETEYYQGYTTARQSFVVEKAVNPAVITAATTVMKNDGIAELYELVTNAQGTVTFRIENDLTEGGCSVEEYTGRFICGSALGDCTVNVSVAGNTNYKSTTGTIRVTVSEKKTDSLTVTQTGTVFGTELAAPVYTRPANPIKDAIITYGGTTLNNKPYSGSAMPDQAGSYTVTVTEETADSIYTGSAQFAILPMSISEASVTVVGAYTYTGSEQIPADADVTVTLNGEKLTADDYELSFTNNVNAGDNKAVATASGKGNYTGKASGTFSIGKAKISSFTAPKAITGLVSNGTRQALIEKGTVEGGKMLYALGTEEKTVPESGWSEEIPAAAEAGTWYVWYMAEGDQNHFSIEARPLKVTIAAPASPQSDPEPAQPDPEPSQPGPEPAQPDPEPAQPDPEPAQPDPEPVQPDSEPAQPDPEPAQPGPEPAQPEPDPAQPNPEPAQPDPEPVQPDSEPAQPDPEPDQPGPEPAQPEPDPVQPGPEPQPDPEPDPPEPQPDLSAYVAEDNQTYTVNPEQQTAVFSAPADQQAGSVTVPDTITYADGTVCKVKEIAPQAFDGMEQLKEVTIGENVEKIGQGAFRNCVSLTRIIIPDKVKIIEKDTFSGCVKLKTVTIGKNTAEIAAGAFKNCAAMTKITLPAKLKKIGKNAFCGCAKLKKITIKTTKLTKKGIGKNCFKGIDKKAVFSCPKGKVKQYKAWLKKPGGAPASVTFR